MLYGARNRIVGPAACEEIAKQIVGSHLIIYEGLGHAAYEEAPDFNQQVLAFLSL